MSTTLDDIEFLSRSPHRVTVLDCLAEAPRTRHDLKERADVSRITIRRLLDDLEERGWIEQKEGQYESTAKGRIVAREFERVRANLSVAENLDGALEWLPLEEFDFDLAYLGDADVLLTADWEGQTEAIRHAANLVAGTERIAGTAIGFSHEVVSEIRDHILTGTAEFEVVIDAGCLRMIQNDSGLRERFQEMLSSGNAVLHRYTGEAPLHMVITFDETVQICGHIDDGPPPGSLETTDPRVVEWSRRYFEQAKATSDRLDVDALEPRVEEPS